MANGDRGQCLRNRLHVLSFLGRCMARLAGIVVSELICEGSDDSFPTAFPILALFAGLSVG